LKIDQPKLYKVIENEHCIGCGFCATICPKNSIEMVYDPKRDSFIPKINNIHEDCSSNCLCYDFCPGENLDLKGLIENKFDQLPEDFLTGHYKDIKIGYSNNPKTRRDSSSGGLVPLILEHLFKTNKIECAYCVVPSQESPYESAGKVIYSTDEIQTIHGSVYHPVNFGKELDKLFGLNKKFAFVGIPCQVEALEKYKQINPAISEYLVLTIGIFCGGYNKFQAFEYYLKEFKIDWSNVNSISFRHGHWPGDIKISSKAKNESSIIPRTNGNTRSGVLRYTAAADGFYMLKRCRLCPDQVNDLADISLGDPHLKRFKTKENYGFSVIISRNRKAKKIIDHLIEKEELVYEESNTNDVIFSQGHTLKNRKYLKAYLSINKLFGGRNPNFKLDERANKPGLRNYVFAIRDLTKLYIFTPKYFSRFYKSFQIIDYLLLSILKPKRFFDRLYKIFFQYKK